MSDETLMKSPRRILWEILRKVQENSLNISLPFKQQEKKQNLDGRMSWQATLCKLPEKLKNLKISDVTLIVGIKPNAKVFESHRILLSVFSEVFEAMFYGPLADKNEVEFPDDDPGAFGVMINYIYTGNEELENVETALEVCRLVDKYMIPQLKVKVVKFLLQNITSDSVIPIFEMATELMEHGLRMECWKHIQQNTTEVLDTSGFICSNCSTVETILANSFINIPTELVIYNALLRWGEEQCKKKGTEVDELNVRGIIEPLFSGVRFLTMSAEEFFRGPGREKYLTESEKISILMNIITPNENEFPVVGSKEKRKRRFESVVMPFSIKANTFKSTNTFPNIRQRSKPFNTDRYIYGVTFYLSETSQSFTVPTSLECNLTIRNTTKKTEIRKAFKEFQVSEQNCKLESDEPIFVAKGEECEILLTGKYQKNQPLYYCNGDCHNNEFCTSDFHFHDILILII